MLIGYLSVRLQVQENTGALGFGLEGGKCPMRAARATVAVLAAVAAGGGWALAQPEGADGRAKSADPARLRAEELAESASRRFNEVMKAERIAQAQPAAPTSGQSAGEGAWSPAKRWLEHSNREFQSLMRRLAQSGGGASTPVPPTPAQSRKPPSPA